MKLIIKKEFPTEKSLRKYIKEKNIEMPEYRLAVIALLCDLEGNIILQRRGNTARDESGKLAEIGGAVEKKDKTLRAALKRELTEEVGKNAEISIDDFISGILQTKFDPRTNQDVNWLFLTYKCTLKKGQLKCNEQGKSIGYETYQKDALPTSEMLKTSKYFLDYYLNHYNKCYSYAMGIGEKISLLDKEKFQINEDEGDYEITFDKENTTTYENFIKENLSVGYWNEYLIDDTIVFLFKENETTVKKYILSKDNNEEVLYMCCSYAEAEFPSIRKMFLETPFYADKLGGIIFYD